MRITEANNGYILEDQDEVWVFEEEDAQEALRKLFEQIASNLGWDYDKYSENNINIQFNKKGTKCE